MEVFDNTAKTRKSHDEIPNLEIREYKLKTYYINTNNNIYETIMEHYEGAGTLKSVTSDAGDELLSNTGMIVGNKKWTASFEVSDNTMNDVLKRLERHDNIINIQNKNIDKLLKRLDKQDEVIAILENTVKRHEVTIAQQAETIAQQAETIAQQAETIAQQAETIAQQAERISSLENTVISLERMMMDLSKMNIVVTCSELFKWIFKMQPQTDKDSGIFNNNNHVKKISEILSILRGSKSLDDSIKSEEDMFREKAGAMLTSRNSEYSHFSKKATLEAKLNLVKNFIDNILSRKEFLVKQINTNRINNSENMEIVTDHLQHITDLENEYQFQFDVIRHYGDLIALITHV